MHFIALVMLLASGRYRSRPVWAERIAHSYLIPASGSGWLLLLVWLLAAEYLLLQADGLFWSGLALVMQLLLLFFLLPHWSALNLTGDYYQHWCRGDYQAAYFKLCDALKGKGQSAVQFDSDSCQAMHMQACAHYIRLSCSGFFTLLFWFICLGLPGVFFAVWAAQQSASLQSVETDVNRQSEAAVQQSSVLVRFILWLPARLLGLTFFVVGNARGAYDHLRAEHPDSERWLLSVALGAVGEPASNQSQSPESMRDEEFRHHAADELLALNVLVRRSAVLWIILCALLTTMGVESPLY